MTFLLQHPGLIGLLALAGVPAVVHLISRARPPVYPFSNVGFLQRVLRSSARVRRPKDRLLLALRTLALLALAVAFLSPVLVSRHAAPPGAEHTTILLIDRSASMAAAEGAGTRFDVACARAAAYLEKARPTAANLIWIDAEPDAAFPEPGPNRSFLVELLQRERPAPESGPPGPAFDLALRQLASARGRRELVVISDFQASAWRDFQPSLPPDVEWIAEQVATTAPPNIAVTGLAAHPAEPVAGQELTLLARVRNFSAEPVRRQMTMDADGARRSQAAELPPWGEAELAFTLRPAAAGPLAITVSLDADTFPADDERFAVVPVRESLRIAVEAPADSAEASLIGRLATALPWLEAVESDAGARKPDFRFLTAWEGDSAAELRHAAHDGTALLVRPAPSCPPAALAELAGVATSAMPEAYLRETTAAGWQVLPTAEHPALALFRDGEFGNPFHGVFRERVALPATLAGQGRPLATFGDGKPAILEFTTDGAPVLLWALPIDPAKTDWPLAGTFLPAIAEILLHSRPRGALEGAGLPAGSALSWSSTDPSHSGAVSLLGPGGDLLDLTESNTAAGLQWSWPGPAAPGIHRWQVSGQTLAATAVNIPDEESDLRALDALPAIGRLDGPPGGLLRKAALANGIPIWHWFALLAVGFLLLESIVHFRGRPPAPAKQNRSPSTQR